MKTNIIKLVLLNPCLRELCILTMFNGSASMKNVENTGLWNNLWTLEFSGLLSFWNQNADLTSFRICVGSPDVFPLSPPYWYIYSYYTSPGFCSYPLQHPLHPICLFKLYLFFLSQFEHHGAYIRSKRWVWWHMLVVTWKEWGESIWNINNIPITGNSFRSLILCNTVSSTIFALEPRPKYLLLSRSLTSVSHSFSSFCSNPPIMLSLDLLLPYVFLFPLYFSFKCSISLIKPKVSVGNHKALKIYLQLRIF